jgi:peptidoglycan/LPS O-acetylase OafA/YrhL
LNTLKEDPLRNNFGFLRLILSIIVVISHYFTFTGKPEFVTIGQGQFKADLGTIAVGGFFAISGYLLTSSAANQNYKDYFIRRIFRIFPGYLVLMLLTSYSLFLLAQLEYLQFKINPFEHYFLRNISLIQFTRKIDGVFELNPIPNVINGSLWSLAPEFICYVVLFLTVKAFGFRISNFRNTLLALLILSIIFGLVVTFLPVANQIIGNVFPGKEVEFLRMLNALQAFLVGSLIRIKEKQNPSQFTASRIKKILLLFLSMLLIYSCYFLVGSVLIAIVVIVSGKRNAKTKISKLCLKQDISYGIYLYHVPLLQYLILFRPDLALNPFIEFLTFVTLSLIAGILSWITIENPSKRLASRITHVRKKREEL